jgi:hypothetical protein
LAPQAVDLIAGEGRVDARAGRRDEEAMMGEAKRRQAASRHEVTFVDSGREPQVPPNPEYPEGIDLDATEGAAVQSCKVPLPYPAPRCGLMTVACKRCGRTIPARFGYRASKSAPPGASLDDDPRAPRYPTAAHSHLRGPEHKTTVVACALTDQRERAGADG